MLVTLVFKATGTVGRSFGRLQDELQLQEARRHILAQLEKIVCYDAQSVRLQTDGKISCRMLEGCKQVTVYSDKQGIYQRTRTNKGHGCESGVAGGGRRFRMAGATLLAANAVRKLRSLP